MAQQYNAYFSYIMDVSQSDLFLPVFPGFNFYFLNICLYTVTEILLVAHFVVSLRIIVKHLTYFSFTVHCIKAANPIQQTYSDKWSYV